MSGPVVDSLKSGADTIGAAVSTATGWSWLHDINEDDYAGLKRKDGTVKMAFEVWENL